MSLHVQTSAHVPSQRAALQPAASPVAASLIGASGFVGLRTTEILSADPTFTVRPVVRSASSLAVLARERLDWRIADLLAATPLAEALRGTEICVHAAIGDAHQIVRMARETYRACALAGVRRLVWLSSASVHRQNPESGTTDNTPLRDDQPLVYNNAKVRAEWALEKLARDGRVEVVRLRPSVVFGPRSRWITDAADKIRSGQAGWIDGGHAICNTIYVDNLVSAIRAAALAPSVAVGQAFLVGDAEPVTWRDFLQAIATHVGADATAFAELPTRAVPREKESRLAPLTLTPVYAALSHKVPDLAKRLAKSITKALRSPTQAPGAWHLRCQPQATLTSEMVLLQQCRWQLSSSKAERLLGYRPHVPFAEGMRRSLAWLDFAEGRHLPEQHWTT